MYSDRCPRLVEEVAAGVRKVFELSEDEELDSFDDTLLMRAWAARNQDYADWTAETIAFMCPKLVQFDWYFLSDRHYILTTPRDHQRVVWSWRIERGKKGPYVMGNLRWTGCLSGDPRPMYPLVGQELERAMELGDRAWVPLV
ncbi:hypothetical protein BC629DRAFT_551230 [Irpex lacteus]|nr:hypothetical protein BC629DRAFT_551230 [Irpex lacteus]